MRGDVAACLVLWGCGAAADGDRVTLELATRADYLDARLEDRVLAPYVAVHPGVRVVQQSAAMQQAPYRERLLMAMAAGSPSWNRSVPSSATAAKVLARAWFNGPLSHMEEAPPDGEALGC